MKFTLLFLTATVGLVTAVPAALSLPFNTRQDDVYTPPNSEMLPQNCTYTKPCKDECRQVQLQLDFQSCNPKLRNGPLQEEFQKKLVSRGPRVL